MFTVEAGGRPIAVANYGTLDKAKKWFEGEVFKEGIAALEDKTGKPLWDGEAELYVRRAYPEEVAEWERSHAKSRREALPHDEDGERVAYLVPVVYPRDDDDDDDDDGDDGE
jgi:hypothetical protein